MMDDSDLSLKVVGLHKPGSIKRIKLHNFLTYADVEFEPGPRLNMVVGANGTGKSTILNAICLGLGGEPKLLGRADDARGFIMHGKEKALMEIELAPFEDQETHVIRREIDRNKGSEKGRGRGASTFYINDDRCTIKDVKELVTETYNISIDNLCTFLPQDKVGSFSGFDAQQLLTETEKTLSRSQHLYTTHQELIDAEAELADGIDNVESLQEELKKLQHENAQLERAKVQMEEREKALEQADLLQKKLLWLQFEELRGRALEFKERKAAIKVELRAAQAELRPLAERAESLAAKKKEKEDQFKKLDQNTQRCQKEIDKQKTKHDTHDDQIENVISEIRELDSKRSKLEAEYEKAQGRLESLEEQQKTHPASPEQVDKEFEEANEKRKTIARNYEMAKREVRGFYEQLKELESKAHAFQQKLSQMNDDAARRRERIFRQDPNLGKIHNWLESNRGKFRHNVWGPIACEVSTKSQNASAFLEQHVPNWALKAFVVQSKEDYDLLYNEVRAKMKIPINIVTVKNGHIEPVVRMYSEQKMKVLKKEHGISGYLDESFTAPDIITQALRTHAAVHRVLVGGEETQKSMDNKGLLEYLSEPDRSLNQDKPQSSVTFTSQGNKSFKYTQTISKYSKKASGRVDDVFPARLLAPGVSERAKKEAEDNLRGVHDEVAALRPSLQAAEKRKDEMEAEAQSVTQKLQAAKATKDNYVKFHAKLVSAQRKLKDAEQALGCDDVAEKKKWVKMLMNRVAHSITALETHADQHEKMIKSTVSSAGIGVSRSSLGLAERQAKEAHGEKKKEFADCENRAVQISNDFIKIKQELAAKKKQAEIEAPLTDANGEPLALKSQLEELEHQTLHDVEAAHEEAILKADSIVANPAVIRQYAELKEKIEMKQAELEALSSSKNNKLGGIETKRKVWESSLQSNVVKINSLFTKYMAIMGCTGEVGLIKGKTSDRQNENGNFKDWGIEIRVSFREKTKAQVLSARVQSGGERSVSTIMYLMALQDMMVSPFRCVDEINQGLDDRNERLVFKRICENSTRPPKNCPTDHSGQYFLITPKLLPNLIEMENEAMTLLFVFNGPFSFKSPSEWNVDDMLGKRKKRLVDDISREQDDENSGNSIPRKTTAKKSRKSN